jgi:hypothetical protein
MKIQNEYFGSPSGVEVKFEHKIDFKNNARYLVVSRVQFSCHAKP